MPKFPKLIHVTREGEGEDGYWQVHESGVSNLDEHGQPVAIYQLVEVGRVQIQKSFQKTRRKS